MKKFFLFLLLVFLSSCAFSASQIPEEFKPFKQIVSFYPFCGYDLSTYNYDYKKDILSIDTECDIYRSGDGGEVDVSNYDNNIIFYIILGLEYNLKTKELKFQYKGYITKEYNNKMQCLGKYYYYDNDISQLKNNKSSVDYYIEDLKSGDNFLKLQKNLRQIRDYMDRKIHTIDELDSF